MEEKKTCSKCKEEKLLTEFTKDKQKKDGFYPWCKACRSVSKKVYYKKHAKQIIETVKQWRLSNPEKVWKNKLKLDYNITPQDFLNQFYKQNQVCAICKQGSIDTVWYIDHDHKCCPQERNICGKCIRGILCRSCNLGLGMFKDNPNILESAKKYLYDYSRRI